MESRYYVTLPVGWNLHSLTHVPRPCWQVRQGTWWPRALCALTPALQGLWSVTCGQRGCCPSQALSVLSSCHRPLLGQRVKVVTHSRQLTF